MEGGSEQGRSIVVLTIVHELGTADKIMIYDYTLDNIINSVHSEFFGYRDYCTLEMNYFCGFNSRLFYFFIQTEVSGSLPFPMVTADWALFLL